MSDFNPSMEAAPAKSGGSGCKVVVIVLGIVGALCATCCCGIFGFGWWSIGVFGDAVGKAYADHPVVVEHLGGIDSCSANFIETAEAQQDDPDANVFDVEGPKGKGKLILIAPGGVDIGSDGAAEMAEDAYLEVNGNRYPLNPGAVPSAGDGVGGF